VILENWEALDRKPCGVGRVDRYNFLETGNCFEFIVQISPCENKLYLCFS
jgi:hypothetical protein